MNRKAIDLTDLYRRIYRLRRRYFTPLQISIAMEIPIGVVRKILMEKRSGSARRKGLDFRKTEVRRKVDVIILDRKTHLIFDVGGALCSGEFKPLQKVLQNSLRSVRDIPVVLRLTDVVDMDEKGLAVLGGFFKRMAERGREIFFLDPPAKIERQFSSSKTLNDIPVFGTELAMEEELLRPLDKSGGRARYRLL